MHTAVRFWRVYDTEQGDVSGRWFHKKSDALKQAHHIRKVGGSPVVEERALNMLRKREVAHALNTWPSGNPDVKERWAAGDLKGFKIRL